MYTYKQSCINAFTVIDTYIHVHIHKHLQKNLHLHIHKYKYVYIISRTRKYVCTHIFKHTYIHM